MTLSDFIEELNIAIRQDGHDIYCNASTAEIIKRCLMKQKEGEKKGKWIYYDPNGFKCSRCGSYLEIECGDVKMNFCPNCGAKMER